MAFTRKQWEIEKKYGWRNIDIGRKP